MTTSVVYTFDINSFSDLHKDAYGMRPNQQYYEWLTSATDDEKQVEWDRLVTIMAQHQAERHEYEVAAIARFERAVESMIENGALDRTTAIRWLVQAESRVNGDIGYFEFLQDIPYGYIFKTTNTVT